MGGCSTFGKLILVAINSLLFLVSLTVLILGIIILANPDLIPDALEKIDVDLDPINTVVGFDVYKFVRSSGVYLVVIGSVLSVVTLCGCCGACCENKFMLSIYTAFMVVIMASEIVLIILAAVMPEELRDQGEKTMLNLLRDKFDFDMDFEGTGKIIKSPGVEELSFTTMQIQLECCGAADYRDFSEFKVSWRNRYLFDRDWLNVSIPASCCKLKNPKKYPTEMANFTDLQACVFNITSGTYHERGCYTAIVDLVNDYMAVVIGVASGVFALELLLVTFACCICCKSGTKANKVNSMYI